ncbi:hypothetical protein [Ornithinimicrobium pratense]|uniref:Uncharacterized protein n=1 Tax=Ornithinimicrobium pratense TaxID=2593973 RepID=A0A5J6V9H0_9MICO|nr:hypothetical protein [Ornithinimicrobium pratense]QFG69846.1 hypothetical protein FY030_15065 [Ornithinimicrobium pratense]
MEEDGAESDALQQAAWEVYGVAPADFVATRTRWVKELRSRKQRDAAKSVAALRKPSVSAAAINALVRAQDPAADRLRDVGTRMRHAQSALDTAGLAALRGERDAVLHDWVEAARAHATGPLTAAVEAEVRDTAVAALADGAATEVVLSGTLTRGLSYSGFGEVDVSDAVARTSTGVVLTRIEGGGGDSATDEAGGEKDDLGEEDEADLGEDDPEDEADLDEEDEADFSAAGDEEDDPEDDEDDLDEEDDLSAEKGLAQLEETLAEAEEQVTAARRERRSLLEAASVAAARVEEAADGLAQARQLLARAEKEAKHAEAEDEQARAALELADEALTAARERRAQARTALEEAEDAD